MKKEELSLQIINPQAAGIDVRSRAPYGCNRPGKNMSTSLIFVHVITNS